MLAAFVKSPDRADALERWKRHLDDKAISDGIASAALLVVLDGNGDLMIWDELRQNGDAAKVESSIAEHFGEDSVVEWARFRRTFAAEDARPLSDASRYVFLPRITVDAALDHAAFNEWYDSTHVPDVARVGLHRAQRYRAEHDTNDYLASYEIDSPAVLQSSELAAVRGFHHFTSSVLHLGRTTAEVLARRSE